MHIELAIILGTIASLLVIIYFLVFEEWSWKKVITWIAGICAFLVSFIMMDSYRIFIIAVIITIIFEYKNLSQR